MDVGRSTPRASHNESVLPLLFWGPVMSTFPDVDAVAGTRELTDLSLPAADCGAQSRVAQSLDHVIDLLSAEQAAQTTSAHRYDALRQHVELSFVMPCRDQAYTLGNCILKALVCLERLGVSGEVIVADYGSRDDSIEIAETLGARVVHVEQDDETAALAAGIRASCGRHVLLGRADDSYDYSQATRFYSALRDGAEWVHGCRLPSGGGRVMPDAMSRPGQWTNRIFNGLTRKCFRVPLRDVLCPVLAFQREHFKQLWERSSSEPLAASELLKLALDTEAAVQEVPITLHAGSAHRGLRNWIQSAWLCLRSLASRY